MDINSLTVGEIRQITTLFAGALLPINEHPYQIGKPYFIRTVTHAYTGRLVAVFPTELVLEDVAWIADTGRFANAMKSGDYSEVEPWPDGRQVIINRGAICDASEANSTPRSQK